MNNEVKEAEHHSVNIEEQQKLVKQAEEVLESFKKLDREIKFSSKELENQLGEIEAKLGQWSNTQSLARDTLEKSLTKLSRETIVLTTLPEKVGKHVNQIIPDIVNEIQKRSFQGFEETISNCFKSIEQLEEKIQSVNRNMLEASIKAFKKKALYLALILSITIFSSTLITYGVMQLFPQKVTIDTKGDITIDGGNVSIWGTGKNGVQKDKKARNQ